MSWRGKFKPTHPEKYEGNPNGIVYRSSLELKMMKKFDRSSSVIRWASEEIAIPYYDPVKKKMRRYFPDFVIRKVSPDGSHETLMIEVKPSSETRKPVHKKGKRRSRIIAEELTWANNQAKWAAAESFCADRGWRFVKMTEREIGLSY